LFVDEKQKGKTPSGPSVATVFQVVGKENQEMIRGAEPFPYLKPQAVITVKTVLVAEYVNEARSKMGSFELARSGLPK
jgi:hypothetical protein